MIDIHSHIIYDIDDGARTLEEAVRLVRLDARQGVTDIFSTSHYSVSHPTSKREILSKLGELREKLDIRGIQVQLHPGHEVLYFDSMPEHLRKGKILTLAGSAYVLVEFYPTDAYQRFLSAVRQIRRCGYLPIIAHAERAPEQHIAPDNREGIRVSFDLQDGRENGWFLIRLSVHDPVMPLNIESDVQGGVQYMAKALYRALEGESTVDLSRLQRFIGAEA